MKILPYALVTLLACTALPAHGAPQVDNEAFFADLLGWSEVPPGQAVVHAGGETWTVPNDDVLPLLATRAGDVDLSSLVAGAAPTDVILGDLWIIGSGSGMCPMVTGVPTPIPPVPLHPQMWIYSGYTGMLQMPPGSFGYATSWTTKTTSVVSEATVVGQIDPFCIEFGTFYIMFTFANGVIASG